MQCAGAIRLRTPFSYCTSHFDENVFSSTNTYLYYWGHGGRSFILHLYKHRVLAALLRTDSSDVAPEICWSHSGNHTCHCSFYHWDHWGPSTPAPLQPPVPLPDVPGGFPQMSLLWSSVPCQKPLSCWLASICFFLGHRTLAFRCVSQQEFGTSAQVGPPGLAVLVYWSMNQ